MTNTDNRLLASASRYLVEPVLGPKIIDTQRGFIAGRSMLANLVRIEEAMATSTCTSDEGGALFFDFAAAFPSAEHEMLFAAFRKLRWPAWLVNFVVCLHCRNSRSIALGGALHAGCELARGVRQGRSLSPLVCAEASDILLRRLGRRIPEARVRAYADDTALVHAAIFQHIGALQDMFIEYERISGLRLNIDKTVFVPLFRYDRDEVRRRLTREAPLRGALPIQDKAKYLGMVVGPGRGTSSWDAPFRKFMERAVLWGQMGVGLLHTFLAYQVFVCSVIMFVAQPDPLPRTFEAIELQACRALFRGPKDWFSVEALKDLKSLSFPKALPDVQSAARAARARVARFENSALGGLRV